MDIEYLDIHDQTAFAGPPILLAASSAGTFFICSIPITAAKSYLPSSSSAEAAKVAILPDAHAASCLEAGIPLKKCLSVEAKKPPKWP